MKHGITYVLVLFLVSMFSCIQEEDGNTYEEPVNLNLHLSSLLSDVKVRVIIAEVATGKVLSNEYPVDLSVPYEKKVKPGYIHIYIIGNEPDRLNFALSIMDHEDGLLPLNITYDEIPKKENPDGGSIESSNLPLFQKIKANVRMKTNQPGRGEVSTDDNNWSDALDIKLERLGVRLSLNARKKTEFSTDNIKIEKIRITNIPQYAYLIPHVYSENNYYLPQYPYEDPTGITLQINDYTPIFDGFIIPEYIPSNTEDESVAVHLNFHILFNSSPVIFSVPIPGDNIYINYSLRRNTFHEINATIISAGGVITSPEIKYTVSPWKDTENQVEIGKIIQFDAAWAEGTIIQAQNIYIPTNGTAEFKFTLARPLGAKWTATLTNPIDFTFEYINGAVSGGLSGDNMERTIRIRPRKPTTSSNVQTQFYITVNYGYDNVELNLPDELIGAENRYIITQIPD